MSDFVACTIVANNYLAYARVFSRSLQARHPEARVFVLIVDRPHPDLDYQAEPFTPVFADELHVPGFAHMAFRYSILELSTALKPYFLRHLHARHGADRALYFDPDILVLGDLSDLIARLEEHDIALTPHITASLEDDRTPAEQDFLLSGIYNLGFLGLAFNQRTQPFLDWWSRRLHHLCLHEVWRGLFVDQRWMDFAPAFLERVAVVHEPRFNVAYWNLSHRTLAKTGDAWSVNGQPLGFFHFSGFDLERPAQISKFQNRFTLKERPDIAPLFDEYAALLHAAEHPRLSRLPYAFGSFANGVAVPVTARRSLRAVDPEGVRWPDPFATQGRDTFFHWLREPLTEGRSLPRIAAALWDQRADLQGAFPAPLGADHGRFLDWLHGPSGRAELDGGWLDALPAESRERLRIDTGRFGAADETGSGLPSLALELHRSRFDLQLAFPEPYGHSRTDYAAWFATFGRLEYHLSAAQVRQVLRLLPPARRLRARFWWTKRRLTAWRTRPHAPRLNGTQSPVAPAALDKDRRYSTSSVFGVNVVGWATAPTGVGEACRGNLAALRSASLAHSVRDLGTPAVSAPAPGALGEPGAMPFEISLYHVNADMTPHVARLLPISLQAGRYRIGYWFWELAHFPLRFAEAFSHLDEVWAPTRFCEASYRSISPIPVRWLPPCVPAPVAEPASRTKLNIPEDAFLFYFAFDALSVPERKNPSGVLAAFRQVVERATGPVHLLLKLNGAESTPELVTRLRAEIRGLPVTLICETLSRSSVHGLTAAADAIVSLHRSEGLGLHLIEAMYLNKPVIATNYGGCTDFLDASTGWPVPFELRALHTACGPYPEGAVWADPDVDAAANAMRHVALRPADVAARTAAARKRVNELYGVEVAAPRLVAALRSIWSEIQRPALRGGVAPESVAAGPPRS